MIFEQTKDLGDTTRLARHVAVVVALLLLGGCVLLAFSHGTHWRLIGASASGIGIGVFAAAKLALWKA